MIVIRKAGYDSINPFSRAGVLIGWRTPAGHPVSGTAGSAAKAMAFERVGGIRHARARCNAGPANMCEGVVVLESAVIFKLDFEGTMPIL
jgi:hypothetical protein